MHAVHGVKIPSPNLVMRTVDISGANKYELLPNVLNCLSGIGAAAKGSLSTYLTLLELLGTTTF